jgi:hypothetical protein
VGHWGRHLSMASCSARLGAAVWHTHPVAAGVAPLALRMSSTNACFSISSGTASDWAWDTRAEPGADDSATRTRNSVSSLSPKVTLREGERRRQGGEQ